MTEKWSDGIFFIHTVPSLHNSLIPLNLIRIIDLRGECLSWSSCAGISSPFGADQVPIQTLVCEDSLVIDQWLNEALIRTWDVWRFCERGKRVLN